MKKSILFLGMLGLFGLSACGRTDSGSPYSSTNNPVEDAFSQSDSGSPLPQADVNAPKTTEEALNNLDSAGAELDKAASEIDSTLKEIDRDVSQSEELIQ